MSAVVIRRKWLGLILATLCVTTGYTLNTLWYLLESKGQIGIITITFNASGEGPYEYAMTIAAIVAAAWSVAIIVEALSRRIT